MTDMTSKYPDQIGDLIEHAFKEAATSSEGPALLATLRVHAAQAIATLELARETKIGNLIALAGLESVAGAAPNPEIAQEAYTAAAMALGLIEEPEVDPDILAARRAALTGDDAAAVALGLMDDPADQSIEEDLK